MALEKFTNGESLASVRAKLNLAIDKINEDGDTAGGGKWQGVYVDGPKLADTYWISGNDIWRTKQAFTSAAAPMAGANWELVMSIPEGKFTRDFTVSLSGGRSLGKYTTGQVVPLNGLTLQEGLELLGIETINPTYSAPTATLSLNGANSNMEVEVGTAMDFTLLSTFIQNDAGALTGYVLKAGATTIYTGTSLGPHVNNRTVERESIAFQGTVSYGEGPTKNTAPSPGTPYPTGKVMAGSITTPTRTLAGLLYIFAGDSSVAANPTTGAAMRTAGASQVTRKENATGTFNISALGLQQYLFLPPGKTLSLVRDLDGNNANITTEYALVDSNFTGRDAGGRNVVGYKKYVRTQAVAYDAVHRHEITIA